MKTFDPQFAALATISAATEKAYGLRFFSPVSQDSNSSGDISPSASPEVIVAAPGRVNLIGEHIDYNDGFVLPMAIDRYTVLAGSVVEGSMCSVYAEDMEEQKSFDLSQPIEPPTGDANWYDYIQGVVAGFQQIHSVPAFQLVIKSSVPLGSGLSSSAALEVAMATFLQQISGCKLTKQQTALLCQKAEHDFAKVPCGIMDQFSSVFGEQDHLMLLDCRDQSIQQVPFAGDQFAVLIANTNVKHALTGGEYAQRRSQCEQALKLLNETSYRNVSIQQLENLPSETDDVLLRRARHVVTEIQRTTETAEAMEAGDWKSVGAAMYESHHSLQHDFEVSCPELDQMVEAAKTAGQRLSDSEGNPVIGSRMTGGGFGGCTVSLVRKSQADAVAREMHQFYESATGIEPTIFVSRPSTGAHVLKHDGSLA